MSAPDQVLVSGLLTGGAPVSIHYRGAGSRSTPGFIWEINGSEGDIRVTGPSGDTQVVRLSLEGGRGDDRTLRPLEVLLEITSDSDYAGRASALAATTPRPRGA